MKFELAIKGNFGVGILEFKTVSLKTYIETNLPAVIPTAMNI
jgi:hypothetical protein